MSASGSTGVMESLTLMLLSHVNIRQGRFCFQLHAVWNLDAEQTGSATDDRAYSLRQLDAE